MTLRDKKNPDFVVKYPSLFLPIGFLIAALSSYLVILLVLKRKESQFVASMPGYFLALLVCLLFFIALFSVVLFAKALRERIFVYDREGLIVFLPAFGSKREFSFRDISEIRVMRMPVFFLGPDDAKVFVRGRKVCSIHSYYKNYALLLEIAKSKGAPITPVPLDRVFY